MTSNLTLKRRSAIKIVRIEMDFGIRSGNDDDDDDDSDYNNNDY